MQARSTVPGQDASPLSEAGSDPSGQSVPRGGLTEEDFKGHKIEKKNKEFYGKW